MNRISLFFMQILIFMALFSCHKSEEPANDRAVKRTVMFYMVAENSLVGFDSYDVSEILKGNEQMMDNDEIVLYIDNNSNPAIYTITKDTKGTLLSDLTPEYQYPSDQNSCSGQALEEFLRYVRTKHPAQTYGLVMWSHGWGWRPSINEGDSRTFVRRRSFGIDNGENSDDDHGNEMSISELHYALQSMGQTLDYVFFDCCFMQCIEVAYELRDVAKYIIGSPAEIPGYGADYSVMIPYLFETTGYEKDIPKTYYTSYAEDDNYGVLISTIDCSQLPQLATSTREIIGDHSILLNASFNDVFDYFQYDLYRFRAASAPDFFDMNSIMQMTYSTSEYSRWKESFDKAVPYAYATDIWKSIFPVVNRIRVVDHEQFGGVSMYVPLEKYSSNSYFYQTDSIFVHGYFDSQWAKDVWQ